MFGSRGRQRRESVRLAAATELYDRFVATDPPPFPTLEDVAMEAIVTGVCDRVDPQAALGVALPVPARDEARVGPLLAAIDLLEPELGRRAPQPATLVLAARCRYALHRETGDVAPLRRAVELWERAAAADDADPVIPHELATALVDLAAFEDADGSLVRAARHALRAVRAETASDKEKATYLCGLSHALGALSRAGTVELRKEAIYQATRAVSLCGEPVDPACGYAMGAALLTSYEATDDITEIEYAVTTLREVVDLDPRPEYLLALARALRLLYPTNGDERLLRDSVDVARRALVAARPCDPKRYLYLENAAHARLLSHAAHGGRGVVDVAVAFQRLAIGCMPASYPGRLAAIGLLADVWLARYEKTGAGVDIGGAVEAALEASRLSRDRPDHHRHLARFGRAGRHVFEMSGDLDFLRRGIIATKRALDSDGVPEDLRAAYLLQLATLTAAYAEHDPDPVNRRAARAMLFDCIKIDDREPHVLAEAGRLLADLAIAAEAWLEAGLACLSTLQAMARMTDIEVSRESQESTLARFSGLASRGAACCLNAGRPATALLTLELGRGVMLTQDIDLYGEVQALRRSAPELSERLAAELRKRDEASAVLDRHRFAAATGSQSRGRTSDMRRVAARNLKVLAAQVRQVPGHERFLKPPTDEQLLAAAEDGPIVVINVSAHRSDALVVQPTGVTVVALPALTPEAVDRLTSQFLAAADPDSDDQVMLDGLEWLWDHLASPVLDVAAPAGGDGPLPRLWWCPTGALSFLPLHAAGYHRADDGRTVLARAVSSYTPTIMALRRVRARRLDPLSEPDLLAVAVSRTAGGEDELPGARAEAAAIAQVLPTVVLADAEASRANLLSALPGYRRVHFTCHARSEPGTPSLSRLVLHEPGDALTIGDIARLDLASVDLAYLSVCDAARPSPTIADEAVHIAGAFLTAGYPHVVGTLWPMPDAVGGLLAGRFYERIVEGGDPAEALHHAVSSLRRDTPDSPVLWANLVHFGR
ncbi:CHAT domain-containing protein [Micromonospora sp. CPCC 205371]|nr:CHAT domain-containing protein [Micromonospora sp. CPCC 205371]